MDIVTEFQCTKSNIETHNIDSFFSLLLPDLSLEKISINHIVEVFIISTEKWKLSWIIKDLSILEREF